MKYDSTAVLVVRRLACCYFSSSHLLAYIESGSRDGKSHRLQNSRQRLQEILLLLTRRQDSDYCIDDSFRWLPLFGLTDAGHGEVPSEKLFSASQCLEFGIRDALAPMKELMIPEVRLGIGCALACLIPEETKSTRLARTKAFEGDCELICVCMAGEYVRNPRGAIPIHRGMVRCSHRTGVSSFFPHKDRSRSPDIQPLAHPLCLLYQLLLTADLRLIPTPPFSIMKQQC